jgi:uncharacterized MAPEG superfamily protein
MTMALWCVLAVGIMPVLTVAIAKWGTRLDNNHPRDWAQTLDGYRRRAYAAHQNAYEAFPLFAAAVIVAQMRGVPQDKLDALAVMVLLARLAYVAFYVLDRATLRSLVWAVGWFGSITIFVSAALV